MVGRVDDRRVAFRGAILNGDGRRVLVVLSKEPQDELLQLAGDGLLLALTQGVKGAPDLARHCNEHQRERAWYGDDDLADQLMWRSRIGLQPCCIRFWSTLGSRPASERSTRPTAVADRLSRRGGLTAGPIDYAREENDDDPDDEDLDRWLPEWLEGPRAAYGDMEDFIEALSDRDRMDRLSIAISCRKAFRRVMDVLRRWPSELEAWYTFSKKCQQGLARAWIVTAGYLARVLGQPPPP